METKLYDLPLKFSEIIKPEGIQSERVSGISLEESIKNNCSLILSTRLQEHKFNDEYGCVLWEKDFELYGSMEKNQEKTNESIRAIIVGNEKRLENIKVEIRLDEEIAESKIIKAKFQRKSIDILIRGSLKSNGDPFNFKKRIYISPMAFE